jgi:hemerythrin superfamily protein
MSITARSSAKTQIINMLKADHQKVKKAFKAFEKLDPESDGDAAEALVAQTVQDLEVHATIEEEIFYPQAREAIKEEDLIAEAEVEHMTVKVLLGQLKSMSARDDKFAATFTVLGEYVNHHIKEEEGEIFEKITKPGVDWETTLSQMTARRAELLEELGVSEEEPEDTAPARTARWSKSAASAESRPQAAGTSRKR